MRQPTWTDLSTFVQLARHLHEESWFSHIALAEDRIALFFYDVMMDPSRNFCRVAVQSDCIIGAIAGKATTHWFSNQISVFDTFLYVRPEYRGTRTAYRLWRSMKSWAVEIGAKELTHGVATAIEANRADRFFKGLGMTHVGGIYKMKL
jgi:GNAT superfamily N-acetyltransferase